MTVIVTGIAGFIGMHTAAHLLAQGETVIGIDNFSDYYPVALKEARIAELATIGGERLTLHRADIGDEAALAAARRAVVRQSPLPAGRAQPSGRTQAAGRARPSR